MARLMTSRRFIRGRVDLRYVTEHASSLLLFPELMRIDRAHGNSMTPFLLPRYFVSVVTFLVTHRLTFRRDASSVWDDNWSLVCRSHPRNV
jgi:hypothetical protein